MSKAHQNNPNHQNHSFGSAELKLSKTGSDEATKPVITEQSKTNQYNTSVHESKELAKLNVNR